MKKILPTLAALSTTFFVGALIAHAQQSIPGDSYVPLAPLPGTFSNTGPGGTAITNLSTYLGGAIKLMIALGAGFSILIAIIGGAQYVAAGSIPDAKNGAKERIQNALIGLALVLSSYLILNSINPDLVNFKLELPAIGETPNTPPPPPPPPGGGPGGGGGTTGTVWPDDAPERTRLQAGGVTVKTPVCTVAGTGTNSQDGQHNCTSVHGLPSSAISGVIALKAACNCSVVVTQGTEFWLHQTHGTPTSFAANVDLRVNSALNGYIFSNGGTPVNPQSGCGVRAADHYRVRGATYVLENPGTSNVHWHVCY